MSLTSPEAWILEEVTFVCDEVLIAKVTEHWWKWNTCHNVVKFIDSMDWSLDKVFTTLAECAWASKDVRALVLEVRCEQ